MLGQYNLFTRTFFYTSSLLYPNNILRTVLSNTIHLYSYLTLRCFIHAKQLNPWGKIPPEKLVDPQLLKFLAFY
jgi:hypothetical protein